MYSREKLGLQGQKDVVSPHDTTEEEEVLKGIGSLEADIGELTILVIDEKLNAAEDIVGEVSKLLRTLQDTDYRTDRISFRNIVDKVYMGLDLLRQRLLTSAYYKLPFQELSELKAIGSNNTGAGDPSIQYFGLEWSSIFSRCYNLGIQIRLLKAGLEQHRLSPDRLKLSLILIHQLSAEIQMHAAAVYSGRLGSSHLSLQIQQQMVTNLGRDASFKSTADKNGPPRKQQKYKGSRTDSALASNVHRSDRIQMRDEAISEDNRIARRQPKYRGSRTDSALVTNEHRSHTREVKTRDRKIRKTSFVDSLSNIFRVGLNL